MPDADAFKFCRECYDFSDVPDADLETCIHYEYMRESVTMVASVREFRAHLRAVERKPATVLDEDFLLSLPLRRISRRMRFVYEASLVAQVAAARGFPAASWLELPATDRERIDGFPDKAGQVQDKWFWKRYPKLTIETSADDLALGGCTLDEWERKRMPESYRHLKPNQKNDFIVSGFIQINPGYATEALVDEFRKWLKLNHRRADEKPEERRGRNTKRDKLNALGALRLRFHCRTLVEAQKLIAPLESKETGMHYSDRTAWKRACDSAIKHFDKMFLLPRDELPLHHTKGWRK